MKNWQITGSLVILILGFLLMSGCTGTGSTGTISQPTVTPTVATAATVVPASPAPGSTQILQGQTLPAGVTSIATTVQVAYSTNDINKHFIDIAFGPDYSYISKWNKELVDIGISGSYNGTDIIMVNNFSKLFNSYSSYTKLSSEIKENRMTADIVLSFMPESSIKNINSDNNWKVSKNRETGTINYIYRGTVGQTTSETVYINSDLKGDSRTHWILRALLYELGFPGETGTYTDSMFFSESDTATSLNKIDLKALELLYGKKISNGMTLTEIKQLLLIDGK